MPPDTSPDRILITGATGFLGRACVDAIGKSPKAAAASLHLAVRNPPQEFGSSGAKGPPISWHSVDLLSPVACRDLIEELKPTHLLHAAWNAVPGQFWSSPDNIGWLRSTLELADAFGRSGGKRFVGVGSCAEYQWNLERYDPLSSPTNPNSLYGEAKVAACHGLFAAARAQGFSAAWGRVFFPYGPGERAEKLIPSVLRALTAGETVATSHGRQVRDFLHVADAAELFAALLFSDQAQGPFNIGSGEGHSLREVLGEMERQLRELGQMKGQIEFGARAPQKGEPAVLIADMTQSFEKLAIRPRISLSEGLKSVIKAHLSA